MRSIAGLIVFTLILLFHTQAQRAQYASLKGTVIDSTSRQPIEAATVSVFLLSDTSLITYAITNKKGEFVLKDIPQAKPCRVLISYSGLNSYAQDFVISPPTRELIINTIQLTKDYTEMNEVVVSAQRPPVLVKKDTLEFNVGSFKTPVNGVVEDLLKQLPGVEVDNEGNITVNGKRVTKITVGGKDFFGSDFKITSKNLPKDIIDKIQIVDNKTREADFRKTTTGNEDKAINITLKKNSRNGLFGRASGGYGSERRYEANSSINYYKGSMQLNFIGFANNINRSGGSGGEFSMSNPISSFSGSNNGITNTRSAGINFGNDFKRGLRIGGSYWYGNSQTVNQTSARRQNILPDTSFIYRGVTNTSRKRQNHRANLGIEYKPDTLTSLYINANIAGATNHSITSNDALSTSMSGIKLNDANNRYKTVSDDKSVSVESFFGRRFNKRGSALTVNVYYANNTRQANDSNKGNSTFYSQDGNTSLDTIDQVSNANDRSKQITTNTIWTEPFSPKLFLQMGYTYSDNQTFAEKKTNNHNPATGQYSLEDTMFSNATNSRVTSHTPQLLLGYKSDILSANIGTSVQWLNQSTGSMRSSKVLDQRFENLFPTFNMNYRYSKTGNMNISYHGRSQQPTVGQLQPAADNSNPLYIRIGNPELKPSFQHSVNYNIQRYQSSDYWNVGVAFNSATNQIVNETWFDSVQYTRPINSNGNWGLSTNFTYSINWKKKDWSLRISLSNYSAFNRNTSFSNKIANITKAYTISQRFSLTYNYKDLLTILPSYAIQYMDTKYSIGLEQSTENINHTIYVSTFVNWPKRFILENLLQYSYNSRTAPGFPKSVTLWNIAFNYQLFKKQQGLLRLTVVDLLKQNTSIFRSITPTYIEDTQVQVLRQYFMCSFIYTLKQF
ncbi:outer membrane beta-barrel protein [Paraflavitalea pollutisoli]|uniref:outer membrane beta-barrel protein n=1 Tax=Paraflavitalea pollutisoli TaxID=3034143 RepID=UPI0023EC895B|nr:outer membrane beta-barrel protein [Paraflavitalea sp. H1-2-19X]